VLSFTVSAESGASPLPIRKGLPEHFPASQRRPQRRQLSAYEPAIPSVTNPINENIYPSSTDNYQPTTRKPKKPQRFSATTMIVDP
jgi:hypothetical protein